MSPEAGSGAEGGLGDQAAWRHRKERRRSSNKRPTSSNEESGHRASQIRCYDRIGLLPSRETLWPAPLQPRRARPARLHGRRPERRVQAEIKELIAGIDHANGMAERMRSLSEPKLSEIESLLERTKAMKGWLVVAKECGCATPEGVRPFPAPGERVLDPQHRPAVDPGRWQGLSPTNRLTRIPAATPGLPWPDNALHRARLLPEATRDSRAWAWRSGPASA
jgi:hypothetical protein